MVICSILHKISARGVTKMQVKSFLWTMGAGIAVGATAAMMLPKNKQVKQAVNSAANSIENAVSQARDYVCGEQ